MTHHTPPEASDTDFGSTSTDAGRPRRGRSRQRPAPGGRATGRPGTAGRPPSTGTRRSHIYVLGVALLMAAVLATAVVVTVREHSPGQASSPAAGPSPASAIAPPNPGPIPPPPIIGSIPYWDLGPGASAIAASPSRIDEISPWVYNIGPGGSVVSTTPRQDAATANTATATLRAQNAPILPSVSNYVGNDFSYDAVAPVLHDPATTARNIASITQLAVSQNYAGIALDYEELQAGDRTAFTAFVQQLAVSLHAAHKTLAVSLFAKTDDAGTDPRDVAQDYAAIGSAADQVWLMTYDYHWDASPPGPVAPADWVHDVLAYATTQIPPQKLSVGLDTSGYDWVGDQGQVISYTQAMQLATSHGAAVQFDPTSQSPWFRYTDPNGTAHEVWFENTASAQAKRSVAASFGVNSVFLWMYGPPDPTLLPALARN